MPDTNPWLRNRPKCDDRHSREGLSAPSYDLGKKNIDAGDKPMLNTEFFNTELIVDFVAVTTAAVLLSVPAMAFLGYTLSMLL